jgi:hypothetical protein
MVLVGTEVTIISSIKKENKATIRRLVEITGFGYNYVRYLCEYLAGNGLLARVAPRAYGLTPEGKKMLEEAIPRPPPKAPPVEEKPPETKKRAKKRRKSIRSIIELTKLQRSR